ncbi:hypothetical protein [Bordetella trematum]|uniref:hypothetical protein n=1 Tax=Bordetella trematum TaxID=123899 RepID=UPI000577976E|nr:hypothetical protein [Bordetella trematum]
MIDAISGALGGLRGAVDLARIAIDTRDAVKLAEIRLALMDHVIDVQDACMRLQEANATLAQDKHTLANEKRELEKQVMQLRQQTAKLAGYERTRTPVGSIVFVETVTKDSSNGPIYACASCMDEDKVTTLQPIHGDTKLHCPTHGEIGFTVEPSGPIGVMIPGRILK